MVVQTAIKLHIFVKTKQTSAQSNLAKATLNPQRKLRFLSNSMLLGFPRVSSRSTILIHSAVLRSHMTDRRPGSSNAIDRISRLQFGLKINNLKRYPMKLMSNRKSIWQQKHWYELWTVPTRRPSKLTNVRRQTGFSSFATVTQPGEGER